LLNEECLALFPAREIAVEETRLRWIASLTGVQSLANRKGSEL